MKDTDLQKASDILLGGIAIIIGAGVLWNAGDGIDRLRDYDYPDTYFFPVLVAFGLIAIGVVLLVRAFLLPAPARWSLLGVIAVAVASGAVVTGVLSFPEAFLRFGPADFAAFFLLLLAAAILVARRSRARATAMVLLGLLLGAVGLDAITGEIRLTLGLERLLDGIDVSLAQAGLILAGDSLLALASPALWLASFRWLEGSWQDRPPAAGPAFLIRAIAFALIGALCYYAYALSHDVLDIGLLFAFGVFGVASKLLGWNRPVLIMAFGLSELIEQNIQRTLLITDGDLTLAFGRPIGGTLLLAAAVLALLAIFLSVRRMQVGRAKA